MKRYIQMIEESRGHSSSFRMHGECDEETEETFIDDQFCKNCRWFNPDIFGGKNCRNPDCEHCGRTPRFGWCDLW